MRITIFVSLLSIAALFCTITASASESEKTEDFDLLDDRSIRVVRDYGKHLGGPLAAGIREKKPDKDEANSTSKPTEYEPTSNINNNRKCEVARTRVNPDPDLARRLANEQFEAYVKKYKKRYANDEAKEKARQRFLSGKDGAYGLNQARCSNADASFGITRYSDWSEKDFVQKLGGVKQQDDQPDHPDSPKFSVTEDQSRFLYKLPRADWRAYGVIPPVRDQLECGGCYAFSTTDMLAAQERIDKKKLYQTALEPYSAQYFIDCMPEPYGYGCKGGRPLAVLDYMSTCTDCTILVDRCYQYRNRFLRCKEPSLNCRSEVGPKPVISKQVNIISNREAESMATLLRWGPCVAVVDLSPAWQFYNGSGIIREGHCGKKPNHAILVVGYDFTGEVPYYIVRNSWSPDWGDAGYVKVEAGKNTCGIASAVLVTCTDKQKCGKFKGIEDFANNPNIKPNLKPDGTTGSANE